jgi:hypothetical protein
VCFGLEFPEVHADLDARQQLFTFDRNRVALSRLIRANGKLIEDAPLVVSIAYLVNASFTLTSNIAEKTRRSKPGGSQRATLNESSARIKQPQERRRL